MVNELKVSEKQGMILKNFWQWMKDKKYCDSEGFVHCDDFVYGKDIFSYPIGSQCQELLGFMWEYVSTLDKKAMKFEQVFEGLLQRIELNEEDKK